jgi:hypothetical protein
MQIRWQSAISTTTTTLTFAVIDAPDGEVTCVLAGDRVKNFACICSDESGKLLSAAIPSHVR